MTDKNKSEIRMAIGHASMCWNPIPSGIFDEQEANRVADNLIKVLDESPSDSEAVEFAEFVVSMCSHVPKSAAEIDVYIWTYAGKDYTTKELYQLFKSNPQP